MKLPARGVRVNAIAPGLIESDMTDAIPEKMKDAMLAQVPMKRIGQAEASGRSCSLSWQVKNI